MGKGKEIVLDNEVSARYRAFGKELFNRKLAEYTAAGKAELAGRVAALIQLKEIVERDNDLLEVQGGYTSAEQEGRMANDLLNFLEASADLFEAEGVGWMADLTRKKTEEVEDQLFLS